MSFRDICICSSRTFSQPSIFPTHGTGLESSTSSKYYPSIIFIVVIVISLAFFLSVVVEKLTLAIASKSFSKSSSIDLG